MFLFLYHLAWTITAFTFLPFIFLTNNQRILQRLGLRLSNAPLRAGCIWVHALSVGEVYSALPLVDEIKKRYPREDIVFTVTTVQGMQTARNELEGRVEALLQMPLDFWWSVRRLVHYIRPSFFIVIETDVWPGLIYHLKKQGVPTVLVNGRISPRTFRSYRRFRYFIRYMLNGLELCLMQSDLDTRRLLRIGMRAERVKTVGNIKFDRDWEPMTEDEYRYLTNLLNLDQEKVVWIAGSTHEGEEEIILEVFGRLREAFPGLCLIIAPRRIERAVDILHWSLDRGYRTVLGTALRNENEAYEVLILSTMGELDRIYGIAKISFVGGSLVPEGGHNLLEPAIFGQPVLFGPHTHDFVFMSDLLIEAGGGKRVHNKEELYSIMKELLSDPEKRNRIGSRAKAFVERNRGALGRVIGQIGEFIDSKRARAPRP